MQLRSELTICSDCIRTNMYIPSLSVRINCYNEQLNLTL